MKIFKFLAFILIFMFIKRLFALYQNLKVKEKELGDMEKTLYQKKHTDTGVIEVDFKKVD